MDGFPKKVFVYRLCDYHVPVLFATQEGLYLRILDTELASPPSKESQELEVMSKLIGLT